MKRDDSRAVKLPEGSITGSNIGSGHLSVRPAPMFQSANMASITPIFQNRPALIPQAQIGPGVTLYRGETAVVDTTSGPVTLHGASGPVPSSNPTVILPQTPVPVIHGISATIVAPNTTNLKPEGISLPTAPLNVQFLGGYPSTATPPVVIKSQNVNVTPTQVSIQPQIGQGVTVVATQKVAPINHSQTFIRPVSAATIVTHKSAPTNICSVNVSTTPPAATTGRSQTPLKVEDALTYLDKVKYKFGNQPQIYNDFLDIMREFKSQSIDTPGVIARVSSLFRGHPELIIGFNTFLPHGYKIEVHPGDKISLTVPGMTGPAIQSVIQTPHGEQCITTRGSEKQILSNLTNEFQEPTVMPPPAHTPHATALALFQKPQSEVSIHKTLKPLPAHSQTPERSWRGKQKITSEPEINHAVTYVNKIKQRFQDTPEVYKQFLDILHGYRKDQKNGIRPQESEVYTKVSKLFKDQEDLLVEFGLFLPEVCNENARPPENSVSPMPSLQSEIHKDLRQEAFHDQPLNGLGIKRNVSGVTQPPPMKKFRSDVVHDMSLADMAKYASMEEFEFFDNVRKAIFYPDAYENFLRCVVLYNQEIVSRNELVQMVTPTLSKHPELFKWFKDFIGYTPEANMRGSSGVDFVRHKSAYLTEGDRRKPDPERAKRSKLPPEVSMEIDFSGCKRLGASYCAYPKDVIQPSCSGRTLLCKEVLNDTWVSVPSWSEDSQFVASRKTQFEEAMYRSEDERFEFDMVLETNKDTIKVLESVQRKLCRLTPDDASKFKLDDCLGGNSPTIHHRAIRRLYGEKAQDIIDGLKCNPNVAVPIVLKRLKAKDQEWRDALKNFHKVWREQNDKFYLKSLDHQCGIFKQSDLRNIRSKTLMNEIEDSHHERREGSNIVGPHLTFKYNENDYCIVNDVNKLLLHCLEKAENLRRGEKRKIKKLLKHFLMDCFKLHSLELSGDELEVDGTDSGPEDEFCADLSRQPTSARAERAQKRHQREDMDTSSENEEDEGMEGDEEEAANESDVDKKSIAKRQENKTIKGKIKNPDNSKQPKSKEADKQETQVKDEDKVENSESENLSQAAGETDEKAEFDFANLDELNFETKDGRRTPLHARDMDQDETYTLLYVNSYWYIFFRLHQLLCERLVKMKNRAETIASEESADKKDAKHFVAQALRLKPKGDIPLEQYYPAFLKMLRSLIAGSLDVQTYEDTLREMFGIHAYIAFTLDKVLASATKQLQVLVSEEVSVKLLQLHQSERKNSATGGSCGSASKQQFSELLYKKKAENLLRNENLVKIIIYHQSGVIAFELFVTPNESDSDDETSKPLNDYIEHFVENQHRIIPEEVPEGRSRPVFLMRSIRKFRNKHGMGTQNINFGDEPPSSQSPMVVIEDNVQIQIGEKFRIAFAANSRSSFHKLYALERARKTHKTVSQFKSKLFSSWHEGWVSQNVSADQTANVQKWFMGQIDGMKGHKTRQVARNFLSRAPYRLHHIWTVDMPE